MSHPKSPDHSFCFPIVVRPPHWCGQPSIHSLVSWLQKIDRWLNSNHPPSKKCASFVFTILTALCFWIFGRQVFENFWVSARRFPFLLRRESSRRTIIVYLAWGYSPLFRLLLWSSYSPYLYLWYNPLYFFISKDTRHKKWIIKCKTLCRQRQGQHLWCCPCFHLLS